MSEYAIVWKFCRERLHQAVSDLTDEQVRWRPHPDAHTICELLYHMAGAEHYFWARLTGSDPAATPYEAKLDAAVRDNFLREAEFPFGPDEQTKEKALAALEFSAAQIGPVIENPTEEQKRRKMISPIGPEIEGEGGLTRIAQHAAYHTGQIWMMRMDPRFPA